MQLIPSMDLMYGRLVRLRHGDPKQATFYDFTPEQWMGQLLQAGAARVHLVDLDAAFGGPFQEAFADFPERFPGIRFQIGGGLRNLSAIENVLELGFDAVVGTLAVENPQALAAFPSDRVIIALDMRNEQVVTRGWQTSSGRSNEEIFESLLSLGFNRALVTDVGRDGTLEGPGLKATELVAKAGFQVQASGGLKSIEDLDALSKIPGIVGAISGKALMEEHISIQDPRVRAALKGGA